MLGLCGNHWRGLNPGRPSADHADALAGEIYTVVWPLARVVPVALELPQAGNVGYVGGGEAADGSDEKLHNECLVVFRADAPAIGRLVVMRRRHPAVELNVALQVELVGDDIQISQNFGLAGIAFGPLP